MTEQKVNFYEVMKNVGELDAGKMNTKFSEALNLKVGEKNCLFAVIGENDPTPEEKAQAEKTLLVTVTGKEDGSIEKIKTVLNDPAATVDQKKEAAEQYIILAGTFNAALSNMGDEGLQLGDVRGVEERFKGTAFEGIGEAIVATTYRDEAIRPFVSEINKKINLPETNKLFLKKKEEILTNKFFELEETEGLDEDQKMRLQTALNNYLENLHERIENEESLEKAGGKASGKKGKGGKEEEEYLADMDGVDPGAGSGEATTQPERVRPYELQLENLVLAILNGDPTRYDYKFPPEWAKKMTEKEREVVRIMVKIAELANAKERSKANPDSFGSLVDITDLEMKTLYEDKEAKGSFKTAAEFMVQDLFQWGEIENGPNEKIKILQLKTIKDEKGKDRTAPSVEEFIGNKKLYLEKLAWKIEDNKLFHEDGSLLTQEQKDYIKKITLKVEKNEFVKETSIRLRVATVASWFYVSDVMESADSLRAFKNVKGVKSDFLGAAMNPESKLFSKLYLSDAKEAYDQSESEIYGGNVGMYASEKLNYDNKGEWRAKFKDKDPKARYYLFPKRIGFSALDRFIDQPDSDIKQGQSLAQALMDGKFFEFKNIDTPKAYADYRDFLADGVLVLNSFLTGKMPKKEDRGGDGGKWYTDLTNAVKMFEQARAIDVDGKTIVSVKFTEDPNLYATIVANSVQMDVMNNRIWKITPPEKISYHSYITDISERIFNPLVKKGLNVVELKRRFKQKFGVGENMIQTLKIQEGEAFWSARENDRIRGLIKKGWTQTTP